MDDDHPINPDEPSDENPEESFAELFESYAVGMNVKSEIRISKSEIRRARHPTGRGCGGRP